MKPKVRIAFELPTKLMTEGEYEGLPFSISNNYTVSLSEKANLRRDLENWRGRKFTDIELEGFKIKKVISLPCMIQVVHNIKGDKTYANIGSIASLPEGVECPDAVNKPLVYDNDTATDKDFLALPEWLQKKINRTEVEMTVPHSENPGDGLNDDIPF